MVRNEPKFDKHKCLKCQYHSVGHAGYPTRVGKRIVRVFCNYSSIMGKSCLKPNGAFETTDTRGDDYSGCKLFVKGDAIKST